MAITPIKALLFLVGGSAAATATAYVSGAFDAYFGAPPPEVAALPSAPSVSGKGNRITGEAAPAPPSVEPSPGPSSGNPATAPPDASAAAAETPASEAAVEAAPAGKAASPDPARPTEPAGLAPTVIPSFDLVRVDSDGSMVVAGKAGPRTRIDVVAGADVIGSAAASPEGDFAIVLDKPLEPGDYQISLRSTGPGEVVANSAETAIVSVPEDAGGEVLAMVEEPGKPAELITVPEAASSASGTPAPAGQTVAPQTMAPPLETPAPEAPAAAAGHQEQQAAASTAEPPAMQQPSATAGPPTAQQPAPPLSPAAGETSVQPPVESAAAAEPSATAGEPREALPAPAPPAAAPAASPAVMVEAVEIEGSMVFVAGSTDPGRRVRVYADSILLGDAVASPQGRFLVEAMRDLPEGDHVIRVDVIDADGTTVVARAAVPFEREPGETIAAVAQPAVAEAPATAPRGDADAHPAEAAAPAAPGVEIAASDPAATKSPPPAGGLEATAPKLHSVDGAVIIRRGDSLWRISRRVYGRGTRYSTIYLANREQITDPDRIWPGQVFKVPDRSNEGEAADMGSMGGQATTLPDRAGKAARQ